MVKVSAPEFVQGFQPFEVMRVIRMFLLGMVKMGRTMTPAFSGAGTYAVILMCGAALMGVSPPICTLPPTVRPAPTLTPAPAVIPADVVRPPLIRPLPETL